MKKYQSIFHILLISTIFIIFSCKNKNIEKKTVHSQRKITTKVFQTEKGWGYDIYIGDKHYIHQTEIPAIQGTQGFSNKLQASKTAAFVAKKIHKGIIPPSVTPDELDSLGVLD